MTLPIASLILGARRRMGWEQSELAQRLRTPVSQQTVSRWEKGGSRPRRDLVVELAELFGEDPVEFLEAAGYTRVSDKPRAVPRPVRPQLTILPVWELAPDKFEELVADLGQELRPDTFVSRFGGQGDTQYGVDIVAEKDSRYVLTYQCKRREEFGPRDVRDAVARVTIDADAHFLVISRRSASPESRKEMQAHPGWTLWDAQDISRNIRGLPLDKSIRIVDTYFPGWREEFLGVPEPGPWLQPSEFFQSVATGAFYSHDWTLVGRGAELDKLLAFISDPVQQIGFVIGRGGIGKSKLLWEVSRTAQLQSVTVRFAKPGVEFKPQDPDLLPADAPLLIIIDDAHERDDLKSVLSDVSRLRPNAKILLALRPYATQLLAADLRQLGLRIEDLPQVMLSELTHTDAEALAIEALGPDGPRHLGERLGYLTKDSPFLTVIAGILIRRGLLDPACVDHEESVRREILKTFREVLVAHPISGESELRRSVLDGIAALQPFRTGDPGFQLILSRLIDRPYDRAISHVRALEGAGVLMRRGDSLRVVPDLLADMVLSQASFDEGSRASTGYLERVWNAAEGKAFQHIFVNAARIDWQVRHDDPNTPTLIATLWDAIEEAIHEAGVVGRINAMKLLQKVAYFQPERSLNLAQWIVDNPTDVVEDLDKPLLRAYPATYRGVLNEVPAVIQAIAYNMVYLRDAMHLLWALAATDKRESNRYPEHPIRVLQSIAAYHRAKPLAYNDVVIDVTTTWFETDRLTKDGPSPFDVLEPMLATEGSEDSSDGYAIRFQPFSINPTVVEPYRDRIISLALKELASHEIWRANRALKVIEASLHFPIGLFGRQTSPEEKRAWVPNFLKTLESLRATVSTIPLDPVVAVSLRRSLLWHLEYSDIGTSEVARSVVEAIPDSLEVRTATALFDGWGQLLKGRTTDLEEIDAKQEVQRQSLAAELVKSRSQNALIELLIARLAAQREAFGGTAGSPGQFASVLVKASPPLGLAICQRVESDPESPLMEILAVVIASLAEESPDRVISAILDLLATRDVRVRRTVAGSLGWNRGRRQSLLRGEFEIILDLTTDEDPFVRQLTVRTIQRLATDHPAEALSLIGRVDFRDSPKVADEVFVTFSRLGGLRWSDVAPDDLKSILTQLVECPSIEEHWVQEFLFTLSAERPKDVVRLLRQRIERWEQLGYGEYNPLPFHWSYPLQVRSDPDLINILRELCEWLAQDPGSWMRQDAGGRLIAAIIQDFNDPDVAMFFDEAFGLRSATEMAALASILRRMPHNFVLANSDLVSRALRSASSVGADSLERIAGALHSAAVSGSYSGAPGQPFSRDVEQRDKASALARSFPPGSIEEKFYRSLQRSAEERIRWSADRDEGLLDGREW